MKICSKCGEVKPFSEFYRHPKTADGLLGKCKSCYRADVTENRHAKLERYREYDRKRGGRMRPGYLQKYRREHPGQAAAHAAVARALQLGMLVNQRPAGIAAAPSGSSAITPTTPITLACRGCARPATASCTETLKNWKPPSHDRARSACGAPHGDADRRMHKPAPIRRTVAHRIATDGRLTAHHPAALQPRLSIRSST